MAIFNSYVKLPEGILNDIKYRNYIDIWTIWRCPKTGIPQIIHL